MDARRQRATLQRIARLAMRKVVWSGRLAFRRKDYLDRNFMRKFHVSGELGG
ncbi:MAG TPA: hypothetical protein VFF01_00185 [Candidatus Deferrimicrobiaceae bacterium]|nr:hypothetical protein [Candidatus Deferrimicrobiaceae bacterium]